MFFALFMLNDPPTCPVRYSDQVPLSGRVSHNGDPNLREHVLNARAKLQKDEDSKLRMVKKAPNRKIDLAVAASMAIKRILYLNV
jgi:phage terminase large subunit-like protein